MQKLKNNFLKVCAMKNLDFSLFYVPYFYEKTRFQTKTVRKQYERPTHFE